MDQYTPTNDTMNNGMPTNDNQPQKPPAQGLSIASLVLGIVGFVACCLPLLGYPVTITGLVLGIVAKTKGAGGMAIAGIVLCIITFVLTLINSIGGVLLNSFAW